MVEQTNENPESMQIAKAPFTLQQNRSHWDTTSKDKKTEQTTMRTFFPIHFQLNVFFSHFILFYQILSF
jgi:hypothetical protein